MDDDKKIEKKPEPEIKEDKKHIKPGDIIGKIDVHDTRERRDGPGGNQTEKHPCNLKWVARVFDYYSNDLIRFSFKAAVTCNKQSDT